MIGKNILFCVVVLLDVVQIFDIVVVKSVDMFVCLIYVGNVLVIIQFLDSKKVIIVCISVFDVVGIDGSVIIIFCGLVYVNV